MEQADALETLRQRRSLLLNFRWLLFLWLAATQAVYNLQAESAGYTTLLPLALTLASQLLLRALPLRKMEGLKVYYAVFVFDLMVILMNLQMAGRLRQDLAIAFFLGTFFAALFRRVGGSFVSALVLGAAYMAIRNRAAGGLALVDGGQLLDLPFLVIASIHSGLVAQEAESETEARQRLAADNGALTRKLRNNFFESFRFNQDIKALLDTLPFAMVMLDRSKGVRFFNAGAELVFGIQRKNVLGALLGQAPELASLAEAVERQERNSDGGFEWVDVRPQDGDPMRMILGSYFVAPEDGAPVGTLLMLMPYPFHQAMAQFVESLPLDDRMPAKEFLPSLPPAPSLPSLAALAPLPPLPGLQLGAFKG
ncbi:MAG TPA: PAS domain-containing protein [bacterium]|jgi:PAS domain-containing protein|nr:PAS domain-containing protein [bacterium]